MMNRFVLLLPLALAACATPREACINDVSRDLRVVNNLITESQGNLSRGYAIGERQETYPVRDYCTRTLSTGEEITVRCDRVETRTRTYPVSIDLRAEQAKLDSLLERRRLLDRQVAPLIQQCVAIHPE